MDSALHNDGHNLRILRPALRSTSLDVANVCSMTDSPGGRLRLRARLHSNVLPSFLSLPPDIDVRRKCIHKRPFGDATCDESARKRVFRSRGRARRTRGGGQKKRKEGWKRRRKISRARHPEPHFALAMIPVRIRGENSCRFSARLARSSPGVFHRDADIPRIRNGDGDGDKFSFFFVHAKQYRGRRNTALRGRHFAATTPSIRGLLQRFIRVGYTEKKIFVNIIQCWSNYGAPLL